MKLKYLVYRGKVFQLVVFVIYYLKYFFQNTYFFKSGERWFLEGKVYLYVIYVPLQPSQVISWYLNALKENAWTR